MYFLLFSAVLNNFFLQIIHSVVKISKLQVE